MECPLTLFDLNQQVHLECLHQFNNADEFFEIFTLPLFHSILIYKAMHYNATPEDIQTFRDWLEKIPYLPKDYGDHVIKLFIEGSKGRMEEAKLKYDGFHRVLLEYPEMWTGCDTNDPDICRTMTELVYMTVPLEVCKSGSIIFYIFPQPAENVTFQTIFNLYKVQNLHALKILLDRWNGKLRVVIDMANVTVSHMLMNTPKMSKGAVEHMFYLPLRLQGLHYVNAGPIFDKFITLAKSFVKKKVAERFHTHRDLESIKEFIGNEALPKEYGGTLPSIKEMSDKDCEYLRLKGTEFMDWEKSVIELNKLRPTSSDDIVVGTFKKLQVD